MTEGANVKISNVKMVQDTAINQSAYSNGSSSDTEYGVGFFRSLSTPYDSSLQISSKQVVVKNLTLSGVSVSTTTNSIKKDFSLLGVVLTRVLKILGLSSGLEKDPKSFSTGAFAGVVKGNVQISDCHVEGYQECLMQTAGQVVLSGTFQVLQNMKPFQECLKE